MPRIADAFSLIRNGANIKQGMDDSGYPITRIETISNRTVDRNKMGYAGVTDISKCSDYVLRDGDILMSHINSETHLGKVALYEKQKDETIIHGMNLLCLRPKQELLDSRFAFYYLSSESFLRQIPRITKKSVNQASFNVAALKELTIPIPEIEKQWDIVRGLDKVSELIALRKEQLAKLDQLVKSRFIELFGDPLGNPLGWVSDNMKGICTKITDGEHGSVARIDSGNVFLNAKHIKKDGTIDWKTVTYTSDEVHNKIYARCNPEPGDVLLTTTGTIGNVAIVPDVAPFSMDRGITLLKLNRAKVNSIFVAALLGFECIQDVMNANVHASAIGHLFLNKVMQIPVIVPPIELQNQFATFVEQTDKSKLVIQQSLDKLETLKKSLMQEYFG